MGFFRSGIITPVEHLTIHARKNTVYPSFPYAKMAKDILGASYTVSLAFVGPKTAQKLNHEYRGKTYVPNVLAFPLDEHNGEIFITPSVAHKEAHSFSLSKDGYIGYLFIHALLHLKGYDHGDTMEKAEKRYMTKYRLR